MYKLISAAKLISVATLISVAKPQHKRTSRIVILTSDKYQFQRRSSYLPLVINLLTVKRLKVGDSQTLRTNSEWSEFGIERI